MEATTHSDKSIAELRDRVWELADSIGTCMLITWDGERQRARPMAATIKRDQHAIYFLTDKNSEKVEHARRFPSSAPRSQTPAETSS
jgi:general stress protein 26